MKQIVYQKHIPNSDKFTICRPTITAGKMQRSTLVRLLLITDDISWQRVSVYCVLVILSAPSVNEYFNNLQTDFALN